MPTEESGRLAPEEAAEEFELRPGVRDDLPGLESVYRAATGGPGQPAETRAPHEVHAWVRSLLEPSSRELWVAVRGREYLGFVLLEGEWVNLLFVHPDRPARGVGSALVDLVKALRPGGFGLRVHQANERARRFYLRHGLIELERTDGSTYLDAVPDLQMAWPGADPLAYLRRRIDAVDDELAVLLARRTALTVAVQDHKAATGEQAGPQGRDADREAEIVARMARRVPQLGPDRIARVMHTVIAEGLEAWERSERSPQPDGEALPGED